MTNHLANEKSPYLLQHAENPVDWYPWGDEAFALAEEQGKPIFLSIGYATCHWCHVMEKESFENPELAKLMNEVFINIKVDREELPEVDSVYMEFAQALLSSGGGWPLNVILTPERKPFFAVTYLPPTSKRGLIGLSQFILQIKELWHSEERANLVAQADNLVELFQKAAQVTGEEIPKEQHLQASVELIFEMADPLHGGMKGAPKFPLGYQLDFFMAYGCLKTDSRALFYTELTLDMMARGGICDQLGGGFSRYCIDEQWRIPHFEKMLYDNAILAKTYLEAWKYLGAKRYKKVCEEILDYILSEMTHAEGGFYSAQDADSEGMEGFYYTWTPEEISAALSPEEAEFLSAYYGVTSKGNFEGRNVLYIAQPLEQFPIDLESSRKKLLEVRKKRKPPFKDDKIITAWNGLMIDACIKASSSLQKPSLRREALKAAQFIKDNMWQDGILLRRYRAGEARFSGSLDDYAFLIKGLLSLFEEGSGLEWLEWAVTLTNTVEKIFKVPGKGAFYQSDGKGPVLLRKCEFYDGAEPSGNAVHAENLLRLYQLTLEDHYLQQAEDILRAALTTIETYPPGACYSLLALLRYYDSKAATVVVALDAKETLKEEIIELLASHFSPHRAVIWKGEEESRLLALLPFTVDKVCLDGQTTVYICRGDRCEPPLTAWPEIAKALARVL